MKEKKKIKIGRILLGMLLALVLLAAAGAAWGIFMLGKISPIEEVELLAPEEEDFETDEEVGEDTIDAEEIEWPEDVEETLELSDSGVINILLIGQDTRVAGERARSDSMILLSINTTTGEINMISFMRDLYVQIPGYSDNRINAAYRFGGAALLDEVIEKNFGITIDYNVEIDFTGFEQVIDFLGGVDITLTATEAAYFQNKGYSVREGTNHVGGALALVYARTRYVSTATEANDFGRTQRQRAVILSLISAYKEADLTTQLALLDDLISLVATDMPKSVMIQLLTMSQSFDLDNIGSYRIPGDGMYSSQTIRSMAVLVPDLQACRLYLQQILS